MNIFALSGFINGIIAILFGSFVYFSNRKGKANQLFGLMSASIAFWGISYGIWQMSTDKNTALFWVRMLSIGSTFIPIFFFHWVLNLLDLIKAKKKILILGYVLTFIFLFSSFSSLYIKDLVPILNFNWWPQAGILYTLYIIIGYCGFTAYGFSLLLKSYKTIDGYKQEQIKYVLLGSLLGLGGGITNFPLWYGIAYPPYGTFLVFLYPFMIGYAISKYRLMDIRVVLTEALVGIIGFVLLIQIFTSRTPFEYTWKGSLFVSFMFLGYLLIKSVLQEIKRRKELQQLYQKVEKLNSAKSEFLSIASHQLRTPLTVVKGYISLILDGTYGEVSKKMVRPLKNVFQSNERLLTLVNDLLNLSRLDAEKIELTLGPTSLEKLISDIVEELQINAKKKGLYIKTEKSSKSLPEIMADKDKLRQVILNIIDNAIKYTQNGGITIKTETTLPKEKIIISDTGDGMTKEEIANVFQMFTRATAGIKNHTGGSGVGLYVAKKFIDMHNGKIWIESQGKGKGTTFNIELPIKQTKNEKNTK